MKYSLLACFAAVALSASLGQAALPESTWGWYDVLPRTATPEPGRWSASYSKSLAMSDADDIPMVVILSSYTCSHCAAFDHNLTNRTVTITGTTTKDPSESAWATVKAWQASRGYLFVYAKVWGAGGYGWDEAENKAAWKACGDGNLPLYCLYWKSKGIKTNGTFWTGSGVLTAQQFMDFVDKRFSAYSPTVIDVADPADDNMNGATVLTMAATNSVTAKHTMAAASSDTSDWFKFAVTAGKRYRLAVGDLTSSDATTSAAFFDESSSSSVLMERMDFTRKTMEDLAKGYVFTPSSSGTVYLALTCSGASAKVGYTLSYREFEPVVITFASTAVNVNESATNAVLTVNRSGRLTDAATAQYSTANGTAVAGTAYTAVSAQTLSFAANETSKAIYIKVKDIEGHQGDATFIVSLTNLTEAAAVMTATVTIKDEDLADDSITGDNTAATAKSHVMQDSMLTLSGVDGTEHVLSSSDTADWFSFKTLTSGLTYQVKATAFSKRPSTSAADPAVNFYYGLTKAQSGTAFYTTTLSYLAKNPYRFNAAETADLYVSVTDASLGTTVVRYDLAWQQWVLPVVSFETNALTVTSSATLQKPVTITLKRTKNTEEAVSVKVATAASSLAGVRFTAATNKVTFAAGSETATTTLTLLPDGGVWASGQTMQLVIVEDEAVHQKASLAPAVSSSGFVVVLGALSAGTSGEITHTLNVTIKSEMDEFDASDGSNNANGQASGATALTMSKRTTMTAATLNGSDTVDYYKFAVTATEYVLKFTDIYPEMAEGTMPFTVTITVPGAGEKTLSYADCVAGYYHFTPTAAGTVILKVTRSAAVECVKYSLNYRQWIPATISFTTKAVTVSELAANVRLGVQCDMEVALPVSIRVATKDGTATAGEDYNAFDQTLGWTESDPTSSVKYVSVNLKKTVSEYEGASENFSVILDFSDSEAIDGAITNVIVTITEADAGSVGSFAVAGLQGPSDEEMEAYTTKTMSVTEGDVFKILLSRQDGNAGAATTKLTWSDGSASPVTTTWADLEIQKTVSVTIPVTDGSYNARTSKTLTLSTTTSSAKVVAGKTTLKFLVMDKDQTLSDYRNTVTNVPFSASGNAWFQNSAGKLRTQTLAANGSAVMSATLKGLGTLAFNAVITGSGTLTVKAGSTTLTTVKASGAVSAVVPTGTQRVTVTFTAASAGSSVAIDSVTWTPSDSFNTTGTFNGYVENGAYGLGRFTATVSATGLATGRLMFAGKTFTFSSTSLSGITAKCGTLTLGNLALVIAPDGSVSLIQSGEPVGAGFRNGWADAPLTGAFAENADIPGSYATAGLQATNNAVGYMTVSISKMGSALLAGVLPNGKSFSASTSVFPETGTNLVAMVFMPNATYAEFIALEPNSDGTGRYFIQDENVARSEGVEPITVIGGTYDRALGFSQLCVSADETTTHTFVFLPEYLDGTAVWYSDVVPATIYFGRKNGRGECSKSGVSASLNSLTGLFSGTFLRSTDAGNVQRVTFKGVMLPNVPAESVSCWGMGYWTNEDNVCNPLLLQRSSGND